MANDNWTREQTIVAFNVYCKIPFKNSSARHPQVIKYANIIGRSPAALNMKIGNFGRLDPALKSQGITGLSNGSKLEEVIWEEFNGNWEKLAFESELLIAKFQNKTLEQILEIEALEFPLGIEREQLIKARVNQSFFRATILSSYNQKCCITGLSIPDLLVASHIVPWKSNDKERLNPQNGLCLNSLHDKAFDKGYITISSDYKVKVSKYFNDFKTDEAIKSLFLPLQDRKIKLPDRFLPSKVFLNYHYENIFIK
jgi:putative restriction endonuclease